MNIGLAALRTLKREVWGVTQEVYDSISIVYGKIKHGTYTPAEAEIVKAAIGQKVEASGQMKIENGTAIIPIRGLLMREPGIVEQACFGATSTKTLESDIVKAFSSPDVKSILLDIASPGGAVAGTQRLARVIADNKKETRKTVVSFTGDLMASAAYWIGSAADYIVAEPTADVGSIGVIMTHVDESKALDKEGIKVTHITAGKDKALGASTESLTDEARSYFQNIVNEAYGEFKTAVKTNRGGKLDIEAVATGRVYTATQALQNGLIDKIGTYEDALMACNNSYKGEKMDLQELKTKHPDLVKAVFDEAMASQVQAVAEIETKHKAEVKAAEDSVAVKVQEALAAEKTRRADIKTLAVAGQETLVEKLIEEGATKEVAMAAINADLKERLVKAAAEPAKPKTEADKALDLLNASAPKPIEQTGNEPKNVLAQYNSIKNPLEAAKFYNANAAAIDAATKERK